MSELAYGATLRWLLGSWSGSCICGAKQPVCGKFVVSVIHWGLLPPCFHPLTAYFPLRCARNTYHLTCHALLLLIIKLGGSSGVDRGMLVVPLMVPLNPCFLWEFSHSSQAFYSPETSAAGQALLLVDNMQNRVFLKALCPFLTLTPLLATV